MISVKLFPPRLLFSALFTVTQGEYKWNHVKGHKAALCPVARCLMLIDATEMCCFQHKIQLPPDQSLLSSIIELPWQPLQLLSHIWSREKKHSEIMAVTCSWKWGRRENLPVCRTSVLHITPERDGSLLPPSTYTPQLNTGGFVVASAGRLRHWKICCLFPHNRKYSVSHKKTKPCFSGGQQPRENVDLMLS